MEDRSFQFLERLLTTAGTSGYEERVQAVVRDYAESFVDEMSTDLHGNLILVINPGRPRRVMLAGHCDQIGLIVSHVDDDGFLYTQAIGGWDPQQLVGQRMTVWTAHGPVHGVMSRKPIHLQEDEERKQVPKVKDLWIDIGASSRDDAMEQVQIGDSVTLQLGLQRMKNNLANAPAMDDRTGVWVVVEALRRAKESGPDCSLYSVSTVQEEVGLRGAKTAAYAIDPHVGIAVDVTHASDCPTIDKTQRGDLKLGAGPAVFRGPNMNPRVVTGLREVAAEKDIPYQLAALGRAAPNDSNALQVNRAGVAAGLVAIPNRYMHSAVETISLDDIDHAASLLAAYACTVDETTNLTP